MLQFVIAGLVLGGIYAIASAGLVITYTSSGILNFAFGAIAYFIARFYYYLHSQRNWCIAACGVVAVVIAAPALGVLLYFVLFRYLRLSSPLIKVVATIGLSVAMPAIATLIFGAGPSSRRPAWPRAGAGVPIPRRAVTMDQIIVYICVVATVVAGAVVLRYTEVGPEGAGHGRLAGDDRPVGHQSRRRSRSGCGRSAPSSPGWPGCWRRPSSASTPGNFTLLIAAVVRRRHRGQAAEPAHRGDGRAR